MWSGFYQGLLDYQKDVDKKKEKLAEKLEKRMEKLMTVAATRDAAIKKIPSYKGSLVRLKNKLGGVEGADDILRGVYARPSAGPELEKYIAKVEKEQGGISLSAEQLVDAIEIFEIGEPVASNYIKTGDYFASLEEKDLKDMNVYLEGVRQLSTMPTSQEGTFIYDTKPVQTFESERMKAQDDFLKEGIDKEMTAAIKRGLLKKDGTLRTYTEGGVSRPLDGAFIKQLRTNYRNNIESLLSLKDDDGVLMFGLDTVTRALTSGTPQFVGALERNTAYQDIILNGVSQKVIEKTLQAHEENNTAYLRGVDRKFGTGVAQFIIQSRGFN